MTVFGTADGWCPFADRECQHGAWELACSGCSWRGGTALIGRLLVVQRTTALATLPGSRGSETEWRTARLRRGRGWAQAGRRMTCLACALAELRIGCHRKRSRRHGLHNVGPKSVRASKRGDLWSLAAALRSRSFSGQRPTTCTSQANRLLAA